MNLTTLIKRISGASVKVSEVEEKLNITDSRKVLGIELAYQKEFAHQFTLLKMVKASGLDYVCGIKGFFDYRVIFKSESEEKKGVFYVVRVTPGQLCDNSSKKILKATAKEMQSNLSGAEGIVHFLPFQMNGQRVRRVLSQYANIGFVDLGYNENNIRGRANRYLNKGFNAQSPSKCHYFHP